MNNLYAKIYADPEFQQLQIKRSRFSWTLAAIMLGSYYTYILVIAFKPALLAVPLGIDTIINWGIAVAVGIIVLGFLLTGLYVWRANGEFDSAIEAIVERLSASK